MSYFWDTSTHAWVQPFVAVHQDEKTEDTSSGGTGAIGGTEGEMEDCPKALPSRIAPGDNVKVLTYLNFRSSPDFNEDNKGPALKPGTQVTALGKTVCTEYNLDYILLWQVEIEEGTVGWVAEGSTAQNEYFLEPVGNQ
ncbi:MAG: hypothetical protein MAG431_02436 [Chloroflexi bacterium]|nr:hypothetical protein [Chloroflexota bacterium]